MQLRQCRSTLDGGDGDAEVGDAELVVPAGGELGAQAAVALGQTGDGDRLRADDFDLEAVVGGRHDPARTGAHRDVEVVRPAPGDAAEVDEGRVRGLAELDRDVGG